MKNLTLNNLMQSSRHISLALTVMATLTTGLWATNATAVVKTYHTDTGGSNWVCGAAAPSPMLQGVLTEDPDYACASDALALDVVSSTYIGQWDSQTPYTHDTMVKANDVTLWLDSDVSSSIAEAGLLAVVGFTPGWNPITNSGSGLQGPASTGSKTAGLGNVQILVPAGSSLSLNLYTYSSDTGSYVRLGTSHDALGSIRLSVTEEALCTSPVTNLNASNISSSSATLTWDSNLTLISSDSYKIYRNGELLGTVTDPNFTDNTIQPNTSYNYVVRNYDTTNTCEGPDTSLLVTGVDIIALPDSYAFGEVVVGDTVVKTFTISNATSSEPVTVTSVTLSGTWANLYSITSDTCTNVELAQYQSCTIETTFSPSNVGAKDASLNVIFDGAVAPTVIPLIGGIGLSLLKDIAPGPEHSYPENLTDVNGILYFSADDGEHGHELWISDGTDAGTVLVDINNDIYSGSNPQYLTNVNGILYFTANNGSDGAELWTSDGTPAGTILVKDINTGVGIGSNPQNLTNVNGTLYFTADNGSDGVELWKSDGSPTGTILVKDINTGIGIGSNPAYLTNVNGAYNQYSNTLFFSADDGSNGRVLWKSDGTPAGTVLVTDLQTQTSGASNPLYLTDVNGRLFFSANNGNDRELYMVEGAFGWVVHENINSTSGSNPQHLTNVNGLLLFTADNGSDGIELWKTDGSFGGAELVKNINTGIGIGSNPLELINGNGILYLSANDGENGYELWSSDGTEVGTILFKDLNSNFSYGQPVSSYPSNLTYVNGALFVRAQDATAGLELVGIDISSGDAHVIDINPGPNGVFPLNLIEYDGKLFFTVNDNNFGTEVWYFHPSLLGRSTTSVIPQIADQETYDNNSIEFNFSVSDQDNVSNCSDVVATSDTTNVLVDGSISISSNSDDQTCTITLTPVTDAIGSSVVTLTLYDSTTSFTATWYEAIVVGSADEGASAGVNGIDHTSISSAIAAASTGDTIIVTDGTYKGAGNIDMDFDGENIILKSENGAKKTIIDCQYNGRAFIFQSGESNAAVVQGFTIKDCEAKTPISTRLAGGGIYISASSPSIMNNRFENNYAEEDGGAIFIIVNSAPIIDGNVFIGNTARRISGGDPSGGGAISNQSTSGVGVTIKNCEFEDNTAVFGGAVYLNALAPTVIDRNHFTSNRASQGGAISVYVANGDVTITRSSFTHNVATTSGGAIHSDTVNPFTISNSIFSQNAAGTNGGAINSRDSKIINSSFYANTAEYGGAIIFTGNAIQALITNSILWRNTAEQLGNQIYYTAQTNPLSLLIGFSLLEGGIEGIESNDPSKLYLTVQDNILDVDPLFALDGNLRVMPGSPVIDAGTNTPDVDDSPNFGLSTIDYDGVIRSLDGNNDTINTADIGAFEYDPANKNKLAVSLTSVRVNATINDSPPEVQQLTFRNIGGGNTQWSISEDLPSWLRVDNDSGTASDSLQTVRLYIDHTELTHGIYEGTVDIVDSLSGNLYHRLNVILNANQSLNVPSGYATIQQAIDAAIDGDTVLVASGTYIDDMGDGLQRDKNIDPRGKAIKITSENGPETTIIDCANNGRGFYLKRGEDRRTIIEGFTIKNGDPSNGGLIGGYHHGGGIFSGDNVSASFVNLRLVENKANNLSLSNGGGLVASGAVSIRNCEFTNNIASYFGGGLLLGGSGVEIIDSKFTGNTANIGAGISLEGTEDVLVTNTIFSKNISSSNGGGISIRTTKNLSIFNSIFEGNEANSNGGAIYTEDTGVLNINNCLIYGNTASNNGAGIYAVSGPNFKSNNITNCTLYDNVSTNGTPHGHNVVVINDYLVTNEFTITNSILFQPTTLLQDDVGSRQPGSLDFPEGITITHSTISGTWVGTNTDPYSLTSSAPLFLDAANGDFRLDPASPMIDSGLTLSTLFSDIRGSVRPVDGNTDEPGAQFDRGAYEYSEYFGGIAGDEVAKSLKNLTINGAEQVIGFEYLIQWSDKEPYPAGDPRISQTGEYDVNLALVSNAGLRIELDTFTVTVSAAGYNKYFTFAPEHIGDWKLRVELAADPNQFVESADVIIRYKEVTEYALGTEIIAPAAADQNQKPEVDNEAIVYWSTETNRLYAVGPGTTVVTWYEDEARENPIPVVAQLDYPKSPQLHIADTQAVTLLPEGSRFDAVENKYTDNDSSIAGNNFTASIEGWAVLLFRDADNPVPEQREAFEVVRSYDWNHNVLAKPDEPVFPIEDTAIIGKAITDAGHDASCKNGYAFFEEGFYDGLGVNKAYDRDTREGPIFAVNEDLSGNIKNPASPQDDLVIVWYNKSAISDVCWPENPVRYDAQWPTDPDDFKTIVIASQLGSGALKPDPYGESSNMVIYNQPDPLVLGYNPNEEHAAFFTAQGSSYPGVFPLRSDLNKTDPNGPDALTSESYSLLKYREPLTNEWNMQVFKVVATSASYHVDAGSIVAGNPNDDRYCLNSTGGLITQTACDAEVSAIYHLDADGYLIDPNLPESCFEFSAGTISAQPSCLAADNIETYYLSATSSLVLQTGPATVGFSVDSHGVLVESDIYYRFHYNAIAGSEINPPYPLNQLAFGPCADSYINDVDPSSVDKVLRDKDDKKFSYYGDVDVKLNYFYKLQAGFYYPEKTVGSCVAWLEGLDATFDGLVPVDTTYGIDWPAQVPSLFVGETLVDAKTQTGEPVGLPNIGDQCQVDVLYDAPIVNSGMTYSNYSVNLIDPLTEYSSGPLPYTLADPGANLPQALKPKKDLSTGRWVFTALPYHLQSRLTYDEVDEQLKLKGSYSSGVGEAFLLMNTLSERDIASITALVSGDTFNDKVVEVNNFAIAGRDYPTTGYASLKDAELKALTAGDVHGTGYVTLAFNNHVDCPAPTVLSVISVGGPLYEGDIKVIESPNPFEEKVTLKHNGDFGGNADLRNFQWMYTTTDLPGIPCRPDDQDIACQHTWLPYTDISPTAPSTVTLLGDQVFYEGAADTVIQGTGQQLLTDKWFAVRYNFDNPGDVVDGKWPVSQLNMPGVDSDPISGWTAPQLYEGWIKRVMKKINLFDQKVKDFHATSANTTADMISLAGQPFESAVALSDDPEYLQGLGIIEVYETLLERGNSFATGDFADVNQALLFASNRLADLYMLLGNEAYGDAADPTIGFSAEGGVYGTEASSIYSFQNQTDSLLDEELALLRGKDTNGDMVRPFYNRLVWNFTLGDGEVAYKENYNIVDKNSDGEINEFDAMIQFPQGHGDAWGHYLSASKKYYGLLKNNNFSWIPSIEAILVAGTPVDVDYRDERKFAKVAAAKAKTGAEIVNLTYREHYTADPEGQWQGYKDADSARAWGVDGWSRRAGQGAFFDWVSGNAMLPATSAGEGIEKIDRTTVVELWDVVGSYQSVEAEVDKANAGLNPLGLVSDVVPFDIDPAAVANGETHFEQIYGRAVQAMNNAIAVFNHANESSQLLRRQQDSLTDFQRNVENSEADYNSRLIEVFGYPYADDCGPGKTYDTDYCNNGPDLYHYMYVDASQLMGLEEPEAHEFVVPMKTYFDVTADGVPLAEEKPVTFHISTDSRFGIIKPPEWNSSRKAPGEIQLARSELLQLRGRFDKAIGEYDDLIFSIELQAQLVEDQFALNAEEIRIMKAGKYEQQTLNSSIKSAREFQLDSRKAAQYLRFAAHAASEGIPTAVGFSNDVGGPIRAGILVAAKIAAEVYDIKADDSTISELGHQQAKEITAAQTSIKLATDRGEFAIKQQLLQIENMVRNEATLRLEMYALAEGLKQSADRYLGVIAKGDRLLRDRLRIRTQTAAQIQDYRYKDMTFRIFRNDALQKYRAQFDMASMYVYLAAKAYDYDTTLLDSSSLAGQHFLTSIVKQRTIGQIENGQPLTGTGLADPMKRLWQNFQVLKPQLGFNNPQQETNRFSLRQEMMRITLDSDSNDTWRQALENYRVDNIWDEPEFKRHMRPFGAEGVAEPGLVIPFSTTVTSGLNFFRWPLGGGDSYYSSSNFATKISSVGVWFSNYNAVGLAQTPRIYLVPVGEDILRTPSYDVNDIRTWNVVDQKLPTPFPIVDTEMQNDADWIPSVDTLFDEMFQVRRHSNFRAYHDSGYINQSEMQYDSRLIGRSVWNTEWLLVIPGRSLLYDADEGLETFINGPESIWGPERTGNGISDIKLFFETYSYSGN